MPLRIVHLEDDPMLRDIVKQIVELHNPQNALQQFMDSDSAMRFIESNPDVDLFIIDIKLPGSVSGLTVAKRVRELGCTGDVVITSAFRRPAQQLFTALSCEWAAKPWAPTDIMQKMQEIESRKGA
jgi:DNA-binding NarL/FixJ family response regulator